MEVILLERVEKLGQMGDVVTVKPGYARNYLLPQRKAVTATDEHKEHYEAQKAQLEANNLDQKKDAEAVAEKMEGAIISLIRQAGEAGQLYGSANARDVSIALTEAGFTIARQQVRLDQPIKALGLHPVTVSLHPEVIVSVIANVARSEDEAAIQERTGEAVVGADDDDAPQAEEAAAAEAASEFFEDVAVEEQTDGETETATDEGESAIDEGAEDDSKSGVSAE